MSALALLTGAIRYGSTASERRLDLPEVQGWSSAYVYALPLRGPKIRRMGTSEETDGLRCYKADPPSIASPRAVDADMAPSLDDEELMTREPSDLDAFIGIATGLGMGACLIAVLSIIWCIAN